MLLCKFIFLVAISLFNINRPSIQILWLYGDAIVGNSFKNG